MRKQLLIFLSVSVLVIFLAGCETNLSRIDMTSSRSVTLNIDNKGPEPYSGGPLPMAKNGKSSRYMFTINFSLDPQRIPDISALIIGPSSYPYKLYLNGQLIYKYGDLNDKLRRPIIYTSLVYITSDRLLQENTIEVETMITVEKTPLMEIAITETGAGESYVFWRNFWIIQIICGFTIGILLFVYFSFMFMIAGKRDYRLLWFSLLCATFSLANLNLVFNNIGFSELITSKIGRASYAFSVMMMSFYFMEATGFFFKKTWIKILSFAGAITGFVCIFLASDYNSLNKVFIGFLPYLVGPHLILCTVLLITAIIKQGLKNYVILLIGLSSIIGTSLIDMYNESRSLMPYVWTLSYGFELMVICIFIELAIRQERISRIATQQARDLDKKTTVLQDVFSLINTESKTLVASTENLSVSTREIGTTGNQQAVAVKEIVSTMEDSSSLLDKISNMTSLVRQDADSTARKADDGAIKVKSALEKLESVIGRISESISLITDFNEQLGSITEIVKLIESIATQIRIIAFNASLEAVAAGESGGNFRIVADEVRRLADSTMASVKNIKGKVRSLIGMSENVATVAKHGFSALGESWEIASGMGDSFALIAKAAESSAEATGKIDVSIKEQSEGFSQIVKTLKEISVGVNSFVESAVHTSETMNVLNSIAEKLRDLVLVNMDYFGRDNGNYDNQNLPGTESKTPDVTITETEISREISISSATSVPEAAEVAKADEVSEADEKSFVSAETTVSDEIGKNS